MQLPANQINPALAASSNSSPETGEVARSDGGVDKMAAPCASGDPLPPPAGTPPVSGGEFAHHYAKNIADLKYNRRQLRSHGTPAEGALWKRLQRRQVGGWLFHRQFSVGHYVLDFYCPALRLGIELDGDYHHHLTQPQADYDREQELWTKYQIRLLRFENQLVFTRPQDIEAAILHFASEHGEGHNSSPKVGHESPVDFYGCGSERGLARSDGGV